MPNCKNCQKEFTVADADRQFYNKMDVPEPTWCPSCRQLRRLIWRNERSLYPGTCGLCGKKIVSAFNPKNNRLVYCHDCWWGDKWEASTYAQEFDWSKPFFPQFKELMSRVPQPATFVSRGINSEYCNIAADVSNSYMSFGIRNSEEIMYSRWVDYCKDCADCSYIANCEMCYNAIESSESYGCLYIQDSDNCHDCVLCFDCNGCSNCFGCVGLRNAENYIFNQSVKAEEYEKIVKEFLTSREKFKQYQEEFANLKKLQPHIYSRQKKSTDCEGNYILNAKRCHECYQANGSQDCRFIDYDNGSKDCQDVSCITAGELIYESYSIYKNYQCLGAAICWNSDFMYYCGTCFNSQNCFGCVGFKKGKFSFFNKQYTEEEYEKIKEKIIAHMKTTGEWGEFLPVAVCPFAYNESITSFHFPLSKDQALAAGWPWEDDLGGTFGLENLSVDELSEDIQKVPDNVTEKILACQKCRKNYKILPQELVFYKKLKVPLPVFCSSCRFEGRENKINPRKLWHRQCMCDKSEHGHTGQCANEFETTFALDRPEKVFCEECYQKEIY